ncbi:hypothetical protein HYX12_03870, partial [Candidatus Woesearchaeota archaeon]|nr:hypothetical protein [Candidatus Woesearchaeota archaeon]
MKITTKVAMCLLLSVSVLFIASCSDSSTGSAVGDTAGLLNVKVQDETGKDLGDADVFINDVYKGKTSKYGENKGSKLVILEGNDNKLQVKKQGYFSSKKTSLSTSTGGEQQITVVLEKEAVTL